jgi:hypothetical protein
MRLCGGAAIVLAGAALLAPVPARAQTPVPVTNVDHVRQQLDTPSPLRDTVEMTPPPTFRVSVSEDRVDISRFWGAPDAVSPMVRPSGGPWHHEYVNMVTPDEFKGYGAIFTNGEKAALASQAMMSALMFQYLPNAIAKAVTATRERAARTEVRLALEEFYAVHPEARPAAAAATPP